MKRALHFIFLLLPPYALGDGLLSLATNQITSELFESLGESGYYLDPLSMKVIGRNLLFLACETIFFFFLNLVLEYRWINKLIR